MNIDPSRIDWTSFLGRPAVQPDPELATRAVHERSVLVTGAGGSVGAALALAALRGKPRQLIMLDQSEAGLQRAHRDALAAADVATDVLPVLGNYADPLLLAHLFREHRPELILHAAAYKHLPFLEQHPFSAIANNALGTYQLMQAALDSNLLALLLLISTDKAVEPSSNLGVSKRIAELVVLAFGTPLLRGSAIRLGNVLGSSGSVVPLFLDQIAAGKPLSLTHPEAQRYFLTAAEAERAVFAAAAATRAGRIYVAECGEPRRIHELARYLQEWSLPQSKPPKIEIIGLRAREKLTELFQSPQETLAIWETPQLMLLNSPVPAKSKVQTAITDLQKAVDKRDSRMLFAAIAELVPEYRPL